MRGKGRLFWRRRGRGKHKKKMARERKRVGERKREFVCRSNRVREKVER